MLKSLLIRVHKDIRDDLMYVGASIALVMTAMIPITNEVIISEYERIQTFILIRELFLHGASWGDKGSGIKMRNATQLQTDSPCDHFQSHGDGQTDV